MSVSQQKTQEIDLYSPIAQRGIQSLIGVEPRLREDGGAVKTDDIDSARLLTEHDSCGGHVGSIDPWYAKAIGETGPIRAAGGHCLLLEVENMRVVHVSRCLDRVHPQAQIRTVCLRVVSLR